MMVFIRTLMGKLIFWVSWFLLYFYLRGSLRTRVVIEVDGSILMLRGWHDGNNWALPGGGVHKNEKPKSSATREVLEETGIKIKEKSLVDLGSDNFAERGLSFDIARFGCKLTSKPKVRKQHLEVISLGWLKISEINENMVDKATWRHLQTWLQHR